MQRKSKIFIVFVLILCLGGAVYFLLPRIEYETITGLGNSPVKISTENPYNAFPKVLRVNSTTNASLSYLFAIWYSGDDHIDSKSDGKIYGAFSHDEGMTWDSPRIIYDDPTLDCRNYGIVQATNGTIILFFAKAAVHVPPFDTNEWKDFGVIRSYNNGLNWTTFDSLLVDDNGTTLVSLGSNSGNGYGDPIVENNQILIECYGDKAFWLKSQDNGETWTYLSILDGNPSVTMNEADAIKIGNKIFGFSRTGANEQEKLYYFESLDNGLTWKVKPTNIFGHCPDIIQLPDGRFIVTIRARSTLLNYYIGYFTLPATFASENFETIEISNLSAKCLIKTEFGQRRDIAYTSTVICKDGSLLVVYYNIAAGGVFAQNFTVIP